MSDESLERALQFIISWLNFRHRQIGFPGVSLAISYRGNIVLSRAFGFSDLSRHVPLTTNHLFRTSSITKLFTATVMMQLVEAGNIKLDDRLVIYLPWLAKHPDPRIHDITIQQILIHTSGLARDGEHGDYWQGTIAFPDGPKLHRLILESPLGTEDKSTSKYSNLAFGLIGEIIAKITGSTYGEYLDNRIIKPLGLQDTFPDYTPNLKPRVATGYTRELERHRLPLLVHRSTRALGSAAGICSTPEDVCRFLATRLPGNTTLLRKSSTALIHQKLARGFRAGSPDHTNGLGCGIRQVGNRSLIGHAGSFPGYHGSAAADLDQQLIVVALTNSNDAYDEPLVDGIFSIFNFFQSHPTTIPPELKKFQGRFLSARGADEFVIANNHVIAIKPDSWQPFSSNEVLIPDGPERFRIKQSRGSAYAQGEYVTFTFSPQISTVNYAGTTLWPEQAYLSRYHANQSKIGFVI